MGEPVNVSEARLVMTAEDDDEALRFYGDALGLPERASIASPADGSPDPSA